MEKERPAVVICTLVFPLRGDFVLLGLGKKGYNEGLWNGYGGKVDSGDTSVRHTAVRELEEEVGLTVKQEDLCYHGYMTFVWESEVPGLGVQTARKVVVHMYSTASWQGEPRESDAMGTPTWFSVTELPYNSMPPDNPNWLPLVFAGNNFIGTARYNSAREVVACEVHSADAIPEPLL